MKKILLTILIFIIYFSSNAQNPLRINKFLQDTLIGGFWFIRHDTTHNGDWGLLGSGGGGSGSGTVTSVAQTFTGGLISVGGSPITTSGTLALTVAGTSGGIPYFSSSSTWASSGVLAANALMIGGGAATAPSTTTTGTGVLTALGINTGSAGGVVLFNGALGTPSSGTLTNATGYLGANLVLTDVTTNDASTTQHGFLPKLVSNRIYYVNNSGAWTALALGSSGQVLQSNGATSAPTFETPSSGGITVGTTTITSGTDRRIGFNNAGVYGESANLVFNSNSELLVGGTADVGAYDVQSAVGMWISNVGSGELGFVVASGTSSSSSLGIQNASGVIWNLVSQSLPLAITSAGNLVLSAATGTNILLATSTGVKINAGVAFNGSSEALLEVEATEGNPARFLLDADDGDETTDSWWIDSETDNDLSFKNHTTEYFNITSAGVVTIPNLAGTGSRNVVADANGVLSAPVSDRSVKYNIQPINYGLNTIMQLNPVSFQYRDGWTNYGTGTQLGFIAQDIQQVLPNSTFITPSTGKMGYNANDLIPILVQAIKDLKAEIELLKSR